MILAKKTAFSGYGCRVNNKNVYVSQALYFKKECGIAIYDLESGREVSVITFDEDYAVGNVYSCALNFEYPKRYCYRFFEDETFFADRFSKGIVRIKGEDYSLFCRDLPSKKVTHVFHPFEDTVLYLCHVKGMTAEDKSVGKDAGTFKGIEKKIKYFKSLSVNSVMLMPVYENCSPTEISYRVRTGSEKANYWGFGKAYHFAVKAAFGESQKPGEELFSMINKLHQADIEVCLVMNFLDEPSDYIISVLKYYMNVFGVDGFRLVGTGISYEDIVNEPMFSHTKFYIEDADLAMMELKHPAKVRNLASCSNRFLKEARAFIKGDEDKVAYISYAVRENHNRFAVTRNMTDFSGFTLWDTVCFNRKHNEANEEDNTDGTDYNYSWNCGEEGPTSKKSINKLRLKQVRNAMLLTCLCQGTPMLTAGDEVLNSQGGNNNPYCQDNSTGWVNWSKTGASKKFQSFVMALLAFRRRHVILHQPKEVMMFDYMSCKVPDVSFHSDEAFKFDQTPNSRQFAVFYCGDYSRQYIKTTEDSVYIIYNMNWEKQEFVLPYQDGNWKLLYATDGSTDESFDEDKAKLYTEKSYVSSPRTITVFLFEKSKK